MKTKEKFGITCTPSVWEKFDTIAKGKGMNRSVMLEQYMRSEIQKAEAEADQARQAAANARRR